MEFWSAIEKPTLLLDRQRCLRNIAGMAEKAANSDTRFRPHFKTHQSAEIGGWFRDFGVRAITVSSVDMAYYFAEHGWTDITIAFPLNWRQIGAIDELAHRIQLGVLVESVESVERLQQEVKHPLDVWIKVDVGYHRTGLPWDQPEACIELARRITARGPFRLRGLLTHAGQTYHARSPQEIEHIYQETAQRLNHLKSQLHAAGFPQTETSYGDTPGCSLAESLQDFDEVRPGNFVFYDSMQYALGVCREEQIAVGVACPVVARHPERNEIVIYGGAVHLSKEFLQVDGGGHYGLVSLPGLSGWEPHIPGAWVASLSQEHGIVHLPETAFERVRVGDLLVVLPVHSCLTVDLLKRYTTLEGQVISSMPAK